MISKIRKSTNSIFEISKIESNKGEEKEEKPLTPTAKKKKSLGGSLQKQTLSVVTKQLMAGDPSLTIIHLPRVSLGENNISEFCKLLADNLHIKSVNISHNYIRDKGAKW
jgi:hypothetical protein